MTAVLSGLPVAHLGPGASWQSLVTAISVGVAFVFVLAVIGRVQLEGTDDLVLPLTVVLILSAVAPGASATLSDQIGWAFPLGVVALTGLLAATYTDLELTLRAPATWATAAVAVVAAVALQAPLTAAWHPPEEVTPSPTGPTTGPSPPTGTPDGAVGMGPRAEI